MLTAISRNILTHVDTSRQNCFRQLHVREKFQCIITPSMLDSQSAQRQLLNFPETPLLHRPANIFNFLLPIKKPTTPTSSLAVSFPDATVRKEFFAKNYCPFTHFLYLTVPFVLQEQERHLMFFICLLVLIQLKQLKQILENDRSF